MTTVRLYKAGQVIDTPRVYKGTASQVKVGVEVDQYITVPKGIADKVKTAFALNEPLIAPIAKGQQVGTAKVMSDDGKEVAQLPAGGVAGRAASGHCRPRVGFAAADVPEEVSQQEASIISEQQSSNKPTDDPKSDSDAEAHVRITL